MKRRRVLNKMDKEQQYKLAYTKIQEANNVLVVSHINPDPDAISSIGVIIELLLSLHKKYTAFASHKKEEDFSFIPHEEEVLGEKDFNFQDFDLVICLDCGSLSRTDLQTEIEAAKAEGNIYVIEFDHHPRADDFSDLEIRYPELASTTEVLYGFLDVNGLKINRNTANCILTGILTDTNNFLYPITTDNTIDVASKMLSYGAQFTNIFKNTQQNKSIFSMKLWGIALNNLQINKEYNFAFSVLTYEDINKNMHELGEVNGDVFGDIVAFLSNLNDVKGVMLLREEEKGIIRGNLRSVDSNINVSELAKKLGGGGHPRASGFVIKGNIQKTSSGWKVI